jgi:hypothetical protein
MTLAALRTMLDTTVAELPADGIPDALASAQARLLDRLTAPAEPVAGKLVDAKEMAAILHVPENSNCTRALR